MTAPADLIKEVRLYALSLPMMDIASRDAVEAVAALIWHRERKLRAGTALLPIEAAPKDGKTIILAVLRGDLVAHTGRADLERWAAVSAPMRHPGLADDGFDIGWGIAAPVGHGGFPDDWIAGWLPIPAALIPPRQESPK